MTDIDLSALSQGAFIFGYPLVANLTEVERFTDQGLGALPPGPLNTWSHATQLAGPDDTFVSINNDTIYSIAQIDVSGGPVRLDVPDAAGRYYVLQFVDAWTNNFAYVGKRATGTGAGSFLVVPPGHDGGEGEVIHAPTNIVSIVGRWAVEGAADLPAVAELQRGLRLTPTGPAAGIPKVDAPADDPLRFLEQLRAWSAAFPPAPAEAAYAERFAPLWADADRDALAEGLAAGREQLEAAIKQDVVPRQNGWQPAYHAFDYNDTFFEVGTRTDPEWRISDPATAREVRAAAARAGLWGNHGYEAAYAMIYVDADGEALTGERSYAIRFAQEPPVDAFWSITMYGVPEFWLVANPIDRYSIGDRTPRLRRADDGSLTIVIQHADPGGDERANWLPAPEGAFRPILRMYLPHEAVFDGTYVLPPIERR
jgi:hypothetical protein